MCAPRWIVGRHQRLCSATVDDTPTSLEACKVFDVFHVHFSGAQVEVVVAAARTGA